MIEAHLSPEAAQELAQLAETLNEKLRDAGSSSAERAFGIGCGAGLLPALIVILLLLLFRVVNVILGFTLLVMALLALLGVGMLAASVARSNAIRRVYREQVEPEVAQFRARHQLSGPTLDALLLPLLPEGAPLREFIGEPKAGESNPQC